MKTNCSVVFHSNLCEIQEQGMKRMIGLARVRAGLYYLEESGEQDKKENIPLV